VSTILLVSGLGAGMAASIEMGYRLGKKERDSASGGSTAVESAIFGILGLILAFTFTGALSRFDQRRLLTLKEANAIGTAYLRLDLLPSETQVELRPLYQEYLRQRIDLYQNFAETDRAEALLKSTEKLQNQIWQISSQAVLIERNPGITSLVLGAINEMIDITNDRLQATRMHPPTIIYYFMYSLALFASFFVGYGMSQQGKRSAYHVILFCATFSATIYITLDLEYPRRGFIQIQAGDQLLLELLENMKSEG